MGTKFTVYDNGTNPSKNSGALLEESNTRQELAAICYVSSDTLFLGPISIAAGWLHVWYAFCAGNQCTWIQRPTQDDRHHPWHEHEL